MTTTEAPTYLVAAVRSSFDSTRVLAARHAPRLKTTMAFIAWKFLLSLFKVIYFVSRSSYIILYLPLSTPFPHPRRGFDRFLNSCPIPLAIHLIHPILPFLSSFTPPSSLHHNYIHSPLAPHFAGCGKMHVHVYS